MSSIGMTLLKVLATECNLGARHIKEAIWIRKRAPNTMNRDEGLISHVYDPLLAASAPSIGDQSKGRRLDQPLSLRR